MTGASWGPPVLLGNCTSIALHRVDAINIMVAELFSLGTALILVVMGVLVHDASKTTSRDFSTNLVKRPTLKELERMNAPVGTKEILPWARWTASCPVPLPSLSKKKWQQYLMKKVVAWATAINLKLWWPFLGSSREAHVCGAQQSQHGTPTRSPLYTSKKPVAHQQEACCTPARSPLHAEPGIKIVHLH